MKCVVGLTNRLVGGWPGMHEIVESGRIGRLLSAEALFTTSSVAVFNGLPVNSTPDTSGSTMVCTTTAIRDSVWSKPPRSR